MPADFRLRLDSDNADRFGKIAQEMNTSRDWVINAVLRAIQSIEVQVVVTVSDKPPEKDGKRFFIQKKSTWNSKI